MEGCFTFQWWGCFSDGGGFIFKWGMHPMGGTLVLMGQEAFEKIVGWGRRPPCPLPPHPLRETLSSHAEKNLPRNLCLYFTVTK